MNLHTGTSGFSYKEWKGPFYPEKLPAGKMLAHYSERLRAVEINNTFYRLPKAEVLEKWRNTVGPRFRFSLKASRRITHFSRLRESAYEPTEYLLDTVRTLGESLGALLFQLPPNLKADHELLAGFLARLPEDVPAAFEFRNDSWNTDGTNELLRRHKVALVRSDTDDADADAPLVSTAPWGYVRLRRSAYSETELDSWAERIRRTGWDRAFVFFKHEDDAAGPRLAEDFATRFEGESGSG